MTLFLCFDQRIHQWIAADTHLTFAWLFLSFHQLNENKSIVGGRHVHTYLFRLHDYVDEHSARIAVDRKVNTRTQSVED